MNSQLWKLCYLRYGIYEKPTANIKLDEIALKIKNKTKCHHYFQSTCVDIPVRYAIDWLEKY